jgi:pilus assembly protein CpaB
MDRRLLTVVGTSLLFALVLSAIFYQMVVGARKGGGAKQAKVTTRDVVVAARALPVGVMLTAADLRLEKVSDDQFPKGGFSKVEDLVDRPVLSTILADEPVREGRLAKKGSGMGLGPVIPPGMRAVSVRVNEVVGVAGFVLPGMRVDVLVTGKPTQEATMTKTILQDILVLSAGPNIEPDMRGTAITVPVVTLLVTPEQAETLTLAAENRIQLVLRNSNDRGVEKTPGRALLELYGGAKPAVSARPRVVRAEPPPPPAAPPPPVTEDVVVIRGNTKTVEQVAIRK